MGLFDKLKKTSNAAQEEVLAKEDLSGLSMMDLLEKADQYLNEFNATINKANYAKLENVMEEIAKQVPTVPFAKRTSFNAYTMSYKSNLTVFKQVLTGGRSANPMFDTMVSSTAALFSSLAFMLNQ